ncbi:Maltodextrin glucosidase [Serinicoccus hydrothermalis]|uniref:Maltodextrin glucosidase n=1 Tax=Serinicoccus hydrothermalis TaxID=1758689 RepID=A0A1B1NF49_9MICO|nr:glycoside hydrolase family 13 protein [Serinicoccus hydrothermalis]ANS80033.1 Maltodextrin glucosidase [Serinicoccus hydrothermalis]
MITAESPHHDGSPLYVSDQRPATGAVVSVRVRVPRGSGVGAVHVRTTPDGEQFFTDARLVSREEHEDWWQAEITCHNPVTNYRFLLEGGEEAADGGGQAYRWLNGDGVHPRDVPDTSDFRITTHPAPPAWAQRAVVYQVFPDRFARDAGAEPVGDPGGPRTDLPDWAVPARWDDTVVLDRGNPAQVFGGTLDGVRERLDHLVGLGVDVLYLTPVFPARSNHRYDASTFEAVDPVLGGDAALLRLQEAAHERGIRVMGDITTNHTGDAHEWYAAARRDPDGEFGAWYVRDGEDRGRWVTWLGVESLPKLDHANAGLRARLTEGPQSVIERWLGEGGGFDSWRVDVANMTGRYKGSDLTHVVARETRAAVDRATGGQGLLVAEHTHDHSRDVDGDGWHGVMNYSGFTRPVWTWLRAPGFAPKFLGSPLPVPRLGAELVAETMREFSSIVPWRSWVHSMTLVGSHDTTRIRTLVGEDVEQVKVAAGLLLTMPGIPMITYGDEIGIPGDFGEDGRRPMPWDSQGAGDGRWDEDLAAHYRELIALRRDCPALWGGGMRWLYAEGDVMVFLREHPEQTALVHVARAAHDGVEIPTTQVAGAGAAQGRTPQTAGLDVTGSGVRLAAPGPTVQVWTWATDAPAWEPVPETYRGGW